MAAVTPSRDRGQLILVAGLTVAVILVMLVLLLNTVIYTENLATRGIDSGAGDAIEYRATVVGSVGALIEHENERYDEGYPPVNGVQNGITTIDDALEAHYLTRGTITEARLKNGESSISSGPPIVWQTDVRTFTSSNGEPEWTVTTDQRIEQFTITVETAPPDTGDSPFRLTIDDWSMTIEEDTESRFVVTVDDQDGEAVATTHDTATLEIDISGEEINDESATLNTPSSPTEIGFENGDQATGTFELHGDGTPNGSNLIEYDGGSGEDPYYTHTVESVEVRIHYETSELRFVTEEIVSVEEP